MATNIKGELAEIKKGRYGIDIRIPIHDALALLSEGEVDLIRNAASETTGEPVSSPNLDSYNIDISEDLRIIDSSYSGAEVKNAIRDALYKLSLLCQASKTVITGLAPVPLSGSVDPSGDNYLTGITSGSTTNWQAVVNFLMETGLFEHIDIYNENDCSGITIYTDDSGVSTVLCEFGQRMVDDGNGGTVKVYQLRKPITGGNYAYPRNGTVSALNSVFKPLSVYRGRDAVAIRCENDAIIFSKALYEYEDANNVKQEKNILSVSFGGGYTNSDPGTLIRTFTYNSPMMSDIGYGHSPQEDVKMTLTCLVAEYSEALSVGAYGIVTGLGPTASESALDAIVSFGDKKLYVTNDYFAIEV